MGNPFSHFGRICVNVNGKPVYVELKKNEESRHVIASYHRDTCTLSLYEARGLKNGKWSVRITPEGRLSITRLNTRRPQYDNGSRQTPFQLMY